MHAFVTGAEGFVGGHIVRRFRTHGHRVTASVRSATADIGLSKNVEIVRADLSHDEIPIPSGIDVVVHAAARSPYHGGEAEDFRRDNVLATRRLAEAAISAGCPKCIMLSAISLYGVPPGSIVDEKTDPRPTDPYGVSKVEAERVLAGFADRLSSIILRVPGILGPGAHSAWVARCLTALRNGGRIMAYNPDFPFNNVIHVLNLAAFVEKLANHELCGFDLVTLAARAPMTVRQVLEAIDEWTGRRGSVEFSAERRPAYTISFESAERRYGYAAPTTFDVIRRFVGGEVDVTN